MHELENANSFFYPRKLRNITLRSQESGGIDDQACWHYFAVQHQDSVSVGTVQMLISLESVSVARRLIIALGATAMDAEDTNKIEASKRNARSKNFKVPKRRCFSSGYSISQGTRQGGFHGQGEN